MLSMVGPVKFFIVMGRPEVVASQLCLSAGSTSSAHRHSRDNNVVQT